jgi:hypothetical protein
MAPASAFGTNSTYGMRFWKWRITAASVPGTEIANRSSSIRWSMEA